MTGTFADEAIRALVDRGAIRSEVGIADERIQPASLDLTVGEEGYSVPGSMLPLFDEDVRDVVTRFARRRLDLVNGEVLVRGEVYVVRLAESLALPAHVAAYANNKSSTGRIDVQTRVLTSRSARYDRISPGYDGALWLEIIPKSFDVVLRTGTSLNQAIFFEGRDVLGPQALAVLEAERTLLFTPQGEPLSRQRDGAVLMTLDLDQPIVGWRARKSYRPLDLAAIGAHAPGDYFDRIPRPKDGALFLSREAFYVFSTYEHLVVPPSCAAEMLPYDTSAGEFRAHYAGFFDPGFGAQGRGTPAVLEVRPYEDDLIVRHRQPVCMLAYERLTAPPRRLYGADIASHYAEQRGPRLSKWFL